MQNVAVNEQLPRSPYDIVNGVIYFPRYVGENPFVRARPSLRGLPQQLGTHLDTHCLTFLHIEFDEGRTPPDFRKWEPPRLS